jgi:F0F1-type ATP synthase epsilon subunit
LVSSLLPGYITVFKPCGTQDKYFTNSGYVEVNQNNVLLVLDDVFDISDITKDFLQAKIDNLSKGFNQLYNDDYGFNKTAHSIASYKQFLSFLA